MAKEERGLFLGEESETCVWSDTFFSLLSLSSRMQTPTNQPTTTATVTPSYDEQINTDLARSVRELREEIEIMATEEEPMPQEDSAYETRVKKILERFRDDVQSHATAIEDGDKSVTDGRTKQIQSSLEAWHGKPNAWHTEDTITMKYLRALCFYNPLFDGSKEQETLMLDEGIEVSNRVTMLWGVGLHDSDGSP